MVSLSWPNWPSFLLCSQVFDILSLCPSASASQISEIAGLCHPFGLSGWLFNNCLRWWNKAWVCSIATEHCLPYWTIVPRGKCRVGFTSPQSQHFPIFKLYFTYVAALKYQHTHTHTHSFVYRWVSDRNHGCGAITHTQSFMEQDFLHKAQCGVLVLRNSRYHLGITLETFLNKKIFNNNV